MPICIYCKLDLPTASFNKEHVFPAALTGRRERMPTMESVVCRSCNQRLGDEVILPWLRQSPEGVIDRTHYGIVRSSANDPKKKIGQRVNFKRVVVSLPELQRSGLTYDFVGYLGEDAPERPSDQRGPFGFVRIPVSIRLTESCSGHARYFSNDDLENDALNLSGFVADADRPAEIIAKDDSGAQAAVARARELGARIASYQVRQMPIRFDGEITINLSQSLTSRLLLYIGANYLAKRIGPERLLHHDFDPLRQVVLDNSHKEILPGAPYPFPSWTKPLEVRAVPRFWNGTRYEPDSKHVIIVDSAPHFAGLEVTVSLFGQRTYKVTMAPNLTQLWLPDLAVGAVVDWKAARIEPIRIAARHHHYIP